MKNETPGMTLRAFNMIAGMIVETEEGDLHMVQLTIRDMTKEEVYIASRPFGSFDRNPPVDSVTVHIEDTFKVVGFNSDYIDPCLTDGGTKVTDEYWGSIVADARKDTN